MLPLRALSSAQTVRIAMDSDYHYTEEREVLL